MLMKDALIIIIALLPLTRVKIVLLCGEYLIQRRQAPQTEGSLTGVDTSPLQWRNPLKTQCWKFNSCFYPSNYNLLFLFCINSSDCLRNKNRTKSRFVLPLFVLINVIPPKIQYVKREISASL